MSTREACGENARSVGHDVWSWPLVSQLQHIAQQQATQEGRPPKIRWLGVDAQLAAEDLLNRPPRERGRPDDAREVAKEFLGEILEEGEKLKSQIERSAGARAISAMTLRRAAADLKVHKYKKDGKSYWALRS